VKRSIWKKKRLERRGNLWKSREKLNSIIILKLTRGCNMDCGCSGPKKMAKYVCKKCGREETKEVKEGEVVKSCCGQDMVKK
jgi:hypothetical protein